MKLASYSPGIVAFNSSVPSSSSLKSKPRQPSRRYLRRLLGAEIGNVTHFHGVGTPLLEQSHNYLLHGSPWELTFQCDLCVSVVDVRSSNTEHLRLLAGYHAHRMMFISILELRIKYVMFPEVLQKPSEQCLEIRITQRQTKLIGPALPSMLRVLIRGHTIGHLKAKGARIQECLEYS